MVHRVESFRNDKGMVVLQFLKVSHLSVIPSRIHDVPKLKKWMCELCTSLQIRSQIMIHKLYNICFAWLLDNRTYQLLQLVVAMLNLITY